MTLQCEAGETEPCQKCDSCKKALGKNHPDIIMVNMRNLEQYQY